MSSDPPPLEVFGSPEAGGVLLIARGPEGIAARDAEIVRMTMRKRGVAITPDIEAALERRQREDVERLKGEMLARGVPDKLQKLFAARNKKEARRLGGAMTVTLIELAALKWNADQIGFTHREKQTKHAPPHLVPAHEEMREIFNTKLGEDASPDAQKTLRKLDALQQERRHVDAHMFEKGREWHLFYFSYEDAFELPWKRNHWKEGGPHVHYSSHFFSQRTADEIWVALDERQISIPNVHVRFEYGDK